MFDKVAEKVNIPTIPTREELDALVKRVEALEAKAGVEITEEVKAAVEETAAEVKKVVKKTKKAAPKAKKEDDATEK